MESILANLMKVQGVLAAVVFGSDDGCLEFTAVEPVFEPIMFLAAMRAADENLQVFRTLDKLGDASSFTCELEHGYFLYRQTASARLGVLAQTGVNVAMLDVAMGVAALKLAQAEQRVGPPAGSASGEYSVPYAPPYAPALGTRPSGQRAVAAPAATPPLPTPAARHPATLPPPLPTRGRTTDPPPSPLAPGSHSGVTSQPYEQWSADELLPGGTRVPGTIGPVAMQHVLRSLSRYLGGHAKAVIIEELAHLGATPATARPDVFTDLIYNVAARIPDPGMHDEFVKLALGDRR